MAKQNYRGWRDFPDWGRTR